MQLTALQLMHIMSTLSPDKAYAYLDSLQVALDDFEINTPARIAAFLAQIALESGQLFYWREIASGAQYEGRKDLGNVVPGDGVRFKGRGPIQITGRSNYEKAGIALGLDLLNQPELLELPEYGFRAAAWFWKSRGLNELADANTPASFVAITRRINGGTTALSRRRHYWRLATAALSGTALAASNRN